MLEERSAMRDETRGKGKGEPWQLISGFHVLPSNLWTMEHHHHILTDSEVLQRFNA